MKFLLVDDAQFTRTMLRNMLETEGFVVVGEAENGMRGFELYKELKPDVVILDLIMPVLDGINSIKLIKQEDPKAKVVICSSHSLNETQRLLITLGIEGYITKPFSKGRLMEVINNIERFKDVVFSKE